MKEHPLTAVKGGDSTHNSKVMHTLLNGDLTGPILDFVLLNTAALLYVAGKANTLIEAVALARLSINSGSAKKAFDIFQKESKIKQ